MNELLTAAELKTMFKVTGRFYVVEDVMPSKEQYRNQLVIKWESPVEMAEKNLLVVMLNPGSSLPLCNAHKWKKRQSPGIASTAETDVETAPDPTQYQIMRVMKAGKFSSATLINLFDLRDGSMDSFYEKIKEDFKIGQSIFSSHREEELNAHFVGKSAVLVAWGNPRTKGARDFAKEAYLRIEANKSVHLLKFAKDGSSFPRHPLPRNQKDQANWLNAICGQFVGKSE